MEPHPPIPVLDRAAVSRLLAEGESSEHALVVHNRRVHTLCDPTAWSVLPRANNAPVPLRSLDLSFNNLAQIGSLALAPLVELRELRLYSNKLTAEGLEGSGLEKLGKLERLELHDNRLARLPLGCHLPKLRSLRLERNRLESLAALASMRCTGLTHLFLDANRLSSLVGKAPKEADRAKKGPPLQGGAAWLASFSHLEVLRVTVGSEGRFFGLIESPTVSTLSSCCCF